MEEAANRMEICRDQLSADMYSFVAKEIDYASYFQTLIEVQAEYHRKSLELLQSILPQIKAHQESWVEKPCYGKPLEEHLALIAPSASKLKKLKASLDCGVLDVQEYSADPHAIAGALKSYLRELPEPLMTFDLYEEWIQSSNIQDQDKRLQALLLTCEKLPPANANNFNNITEMMTTVSLQIVGIIEPIIQHADGFYPGEIEFNVTGNYGSPVHTNHNANYSSMPSPDIELAERRHNDQSRRPLSVATDNMMLEFYKKDGMGVRVMDTSWVSRRGSSSSSSSGAARNATSAPPGVAQSPAPSYDPLAPESPVGYGAAPPSPTTLLPASSTLKNKELSPVIGQRGMQVSSVVSVGQMGHAEHSPCTIRRARKLAPIPPKVPYCPSGPMSDQSTGQPSPVSLSPTPPSTPSPYSFSYPQGYATIATPGHFQTTAAAAAAAAAAITTPSLPSPPPSLGGTLTKARPTPKPPRQRPNLPPPQPPSAGTTPGGTSPLPLGETSSSSSSGLLDGLSPGESMSTGTPSPSSRPPAARPSRRRRRSQRAPCYDVTGCPAHPHQHHNNNTLLLRHATPPKPSLTLDLWVFVVTPDA
ncbi:hypothetical protein CRUP_023274, partial [Coryphaenoides rupestris]